jgi:hypothetical protein
VSPKPKPVKAKLTAEQQRARAAERDAVKAKQEERELQDWHDKNCCKICGSASHWWQQCKVRSCAYCHSTEHTKVSWIDFETITCPKLIEKNKKLDESDRKRSAAQARKRSREQLNYYIQWSNELDRYYYGDMHRRNDRSFDKRPYQGQANWDSRRQNQQGRPFGSPGPQQQPQGSPHFQQRGFGSPNRQQPASRTWFSNEPYQGGQYQDGQYPGSQYQGGQYQGGHRDYGDGYGDAGYGEADPSNCFPDFRNQGNQGRQDDYGPWNGRRAGEPLYNDQDQRSHQDSEGGQAGGAGRYEPQQTSRQRSLTPGKRTPDRSSEQKRTPDRQSDSAGEQETAKNIDFTKREQELAREEKSPNKSAETPEQALALVAASMTPQSDARSGNSARERMEALYDEATASLPPSSEHYKKVLMAVVRSTFRHACVATRVVLRNNPKLLSEGQEQLLLGAPWWPIETEPHYWHHMCEEHCEVHLPEKVQAAIRQQGVWPHPPKTHESQVVPEREEMGIFWNFTQKE